MSISRRIEHLEKVVPKEEPLQGSEEEAIAHVNETLKRIALQLDFDLWVEKELLKSKELILEDKLSKHELALLKPDEQF